MPFKPLKKGKRLWHNFQNSLEAIKRLPTNQQIFDRLKVLQQLHNGCKINKVTVILAKEVEKCWKNQDMPVQKYQAINKRIKRLKKDVALNDLFDVLPANAQFKTREDRAYYEKQKIGLGYCSSDIVSWTQHPSKQPRKEPNNDLKSFETTLEYYSASESDQEVIFPSTSSLPISTNLATEIRHKANLSLSQTVTVLNVLQCHLKDHNILSPTRSAINKACNRQAASFSKIIYSFESNGVLRFDGKCFVNLYGSKREIFAVCYNDKLIALPQLPDKKANTVSSFILNLLKEKNLIPAIVISDTEPTNTGRKNGVIVQLKKEYPNIVYEPCRLHVLDLVLKHQFLHYFSDSTTGPNFSYTFVRELKENWTDLKNIHDDCTMGDLPTDDDLPNIEERRKDYKFLLELVKSIRLIRKTGLKGKINIPNQPPSINQARWNSRAIYSLMAELVNVGDERNMLLNDFIIYHWAPAWFGVRSTIYWDKLLTSNICDSGRAVINKNIVQIVDETPLTNEMAERVFRMINEKIPHYKSVETLQNSMLSYFNDSSARMN